MRASLFWRIACLTAAALLVFESPGRSDEPAPAAKAKKEKKSPEKKSEVVDGPADLLMVVPKQFAIYLGSSADGSSVSLQIQREARESTWRLNPDAEIKLRGWWGRLDQLEPGDRVWVWFDVDRKKQPKSVLMLADEMSEQDIHNLPLSLESVDPNGQTVTVVSAKGDTDTVDLTGGMRVRAGRESFDFVQPGQPLVQAKPGDRVFIQRNRHGVQAVLNAEGLEAARAAQKRWLRERWRKQGLPGTITFLHPVSGEMDVMLDHEGMRWGRYLKTGDPVTLAAHVPIKGRVKSAEPIGERTRVRLATQSGLDQESLTVGGRVGLIVPEPPARLQDSPYPLDMDRPRSKRERVEWFLASVYCTCNIAGDRCAGMFYTQASCNENKCGMTKTIRARVSELIDKGLTDKAILAELEKERGPNLLKPHLLQ